MKLFDPTSSPRERSVSLAPRPRDLTGLRVGLIENTKFNSDKLLARIGDILKAEYGVAEWTMYRKHNSSVPAHQEIIDAIRTSSDVVVAGIGD